MSVFGVGRVDAVIGERLLIEVDGRDNHDGVRMRHKDLVRDANAAIWGYTTLRFDYSLVVHDWELVEAAILGALGRRLSQRRIDVSTRRDAASGTGVSRKPCAVATSSGSGPEDGCVSRGG